jgi:hypothetical protein
MNVITNILISIILVIGVFGNLINIHIFKQNEMFQLATFRYLFYLSISDLCVLIIGVPHILVYYYTSYNFRNYSNFVCSIHSFLTIYFTHLSSCLLAAVSVNRLIVLKRKNNNLLMKTLRKPRELTLDSHTTSSTKINSRINFKKSELISLVIACLLFAIDSHYFVFSRIALTSVGNSTQKECASTGHFWFYSFLWPIIDLFIYCFAPFLIMFICSILVIRRLKHLQNSMKTNISNQLTRERGRKNKQVYNLLLLLNTSFLVLVTPVVMLNLFGLLTKYSYLQSIAYFMSYSNHSFNFLFYGFSCKSYRDIFLSDFLNISKFKQAKQKNKKKNNEEANE